MSIETYGTADSTYIEKINFAVFGNQEVIGYSAIGEQLGIIIPEAYENGEPKPGGLIDKRLGVTDNNMYCDTCGLMTNDCPGHFGHTELAEAVFHFGYLDIVKNVLNCVCLQCSKLLITKNKEDIIETLGTSFGKTRFAKIKKLTSNVKFCQYPDNNCGKPVGKISKEITKSGSIQLTVAYMRDEKNDEISDNQQTNISTGKKKKDIEILTPSRVYDIFKNIDDNDCRLMGFDPLKNRPEYFIIKIFPIPPVAIRPSVRLEMLNSGPSEDGLTSKLADIVKDNGRLRKQKDKILMIGEEDKYTQDYLMLLQYDIATYYDNESTLPTSEQKGSKASKSVSERLKGKTGRIRGNLMGKRVNFSARTVITSDPNLGLDELGVPIKIAMNITFPEVVTPFNIDKLSKLVRNGRDIYPGANFVIPYHSLESGKQSKIDLRYRKKSVKLHNGDIVERHIVDHDPVLFNRQPSLHKMSMMCHRIRVIKDESLNTFRLNVTVTTPYNADFDGDEMNMFIPQSVQTQLELANIADVKRQIITPRYSRPIIKFKQDTVLGTYKMTESFKKIEYYDAMNLAMYCNDINMFKIKKEDTNTHDLYSLIIPTNINFIAGDVIVNNGKIIENNNKIKGVMGDSILNQKIVYYSWDRHGPDITKNFFDNAQRLVTNWLLINGFTVGLGDATTDQYVIDDIKSFCEVKQMEVDKLITEMENNPDTLDPETFESNILSTLKASDGEITKKVFEHLKKNQKYNNFYVMIESKAKGSQGNIGQIIGGLGQNVLEFKRIKKKVNNRTLPHFFQNDDRALARGFIPNSYYNGLTPKEFYFHHMTAREGMIDTAIKSVIGDTPIIILQDGISKYVKIGEWIDELLKINFLKILLDISSNEHREMLEIGNNTYIPTTDLHGKIQWGQITHITRHNPSVIMYEIKTNSGRNVIVTDSHSLLIWNAKIEQFERKSASQVINGDFMPVTAQLIEPPIISTYIDLTKNVEIQTFKKILENSYININISEKFEFNDNNGLFLGLYITNGKSDISNTYVQITNTDDTIINFCKEWFEKNNIKYEINSKINNISELSIYIRGYSVLLVKILNQISGKDEHDKFIPSECFNAPKSFIKQLINGIFSGTGVIQQNNIQIKSSSIRLINNINMCLSRLGIFGKIIVDKLKLDNLLNITSIWAQIFKEKIILLSNNKNDKLKLIDTESNKNINDNFTQHNNIVLDQIIEINKINSAIYSKVYDLTVPSTLNFGLANGLHVVDTADSGYLQRKLIKGMEDIIMSYDKTVRSGNNVLMQVIYGDNGINQTHYKEVKLKLVNMGNKEIKKTFCFSVVEQEKMCDEFKLLKDDFISWNNDMYDYMISLRNDLRIIQMKARMNYITMDESFQLPVNMNRIVADARNLTFNGKQERPNPLYIIHAINYILRPDITRISLTKNNDINTIKYGDQKRAKFLFRIALMEYLNPRRCIYEYGLSKIQFDQMIVEIIKSFRKACIEPGEMVGVLTAQSLGETLTQMSITGNTNILIKCESTKTGKSYIKKMTIGNLIDNIYSHNEDKIINIPNHYGSTELNLSNLTDNYYICGVEQNEKVKWNKISHFSRHPTNGNLLKIKTSTGRIITSTKSHNFLKRTKDGIIAINSKDLSLKDRIPVTRNIKYQSNEKVLLFDKYELKLSNNMGWLFGAYLLEGNISYNNIYISNISNKNCHNMYNIGEELDTDIKERTFQGIYGSNVTLSINNKEISKILINTYGIESSERHLPEFIHNTNIDFVKGLLRGYFNVNNNIIYDKNTIKISSKNENLTDDINMLLGYFGIYASKYADNKPDYLITLYHLVIQSKYMYKFLDLIETDFESLYKINGHSEYDNTSEYDNAHEVNDKIPELGHIISRISKVLEIGENYQEDYNLICRTELNILIEKFKNHAIQINKTNEVINDIIYLETIYNGDVIWDEIIEIIELNDTKEYVYDFTIPQNETFMIYNGIIVHNTLNTFHSSGVGVKGMQGIPRFREILSYSKKIQTPYMIIKLTSDIRSDQNIAHKIEAYLKHTILNNLIEHMEIIYDPNSDNILTVDNINKENIYYINGNSTGLENLTWLFKFTISRESMLENDISLLDIKTKFIKYWENYQNNSSVNKKKIILSRIVNGCIMSNFDNSENPIIHIRYDVNNPDNYTLIEIGQYMLNNFSIKGVPTIKKIDRVDKQKVIEYDDDMAIKPTANEWVIYTTGIDLDKIKTIKYIDFNSVYINDIYSAYLNFGIEAARNLILKESDNLYNGSGNSINVTHLGILADIMSNTGNITSIDRHGINRLDTDPLSRASFEKTVEQLLIAAAFNEVDHMRSVSSRIMAGRCIKGGTGLCEIIIDNDIIENSEYGSQSSYITTNSGNLESNPQIEEIYTQKESKEIGEYFDMFMP
jgi:DNA-directed RNA polymerase beta' subunit